MKSILDYIAEETNGKNYKSYKYCFEKVEVPKLEYDDKQGIKVKKSGETDKRYSTKYGMSMFENLAFIKENGLENFLKLEEKKWTCPNCGSGLSVHRDNCLICDYKYR
jgi:ssDNA-binding Zn-finger/Zn-ribbon topoisomerase 1